jgi:glycine cleavage system H protein
VSRKYVLPCAGYDRSGGKIGREAAELLADEDPEVVVGSVAALFAKRPGEVRDFRSSQVICIDGCSVKCASKLAQARGNKDILAVEVTDSIAAIEGSEERRSAVAESVRRLYQKRISNASPDILPKDSNDSAFLIEKIDKFILKVQKGLYYSDNDFWARIEGEDVRIGASDLLQQMASDIFFVELAEIGKKVEFGDDVGGFESTKTVIEIITPISGTILERNELLENSPELVNESPYGPGWFYLVKPDDIDELELLKDASEYITYAVEKAKHELGKKV